MQWMKILTFYKNDAKNYIDSLATFLLKWINWFTKCNQTKGN